MTLDEFGAGLDVDADLEQLRRLVTEAEATVDRIGRTQTALADRLAAERERAVDRISEHIDLDDIDIEQLETFADEPYVILPKAEGEAWVVVPRFVPFQVGYLDRQTASYNVFIVNKFVDWIDQLPPAIRDQVGIEASFEGATVYDDMLELDDPDERDRAWDELGGYVQQGGPFVQRVDEDKIKFSRDREFDVIASLIDGGNLPFAPQPVDDEHLLDEPEGIALRDYQVRAWERFRETGMVGVYWPPGAGKTFLALYAAERLDGRTLVVVPSSTLEQQWTERIEAFCTDSSAYEVRTYQYLTTRDNMADYTGASGPLLTVFDECHRLPANTFAKLATIDTTYRLGLSASPYREDGRTEYIFALTGFPVGLRWQELVAIGAVETPDADVYLYRTTRQKVADIDRLVRQPGKTIVFCDSLDRGQQLADRVGAPFVHGDTPKTDRMDIFREHRVVISSRVGDEGVSLPDLDRVIEHDFHGGSRRQEAQRYGRLMHGASEGEHVIQMTDDEYDRFGDRLLALEQQGIAIRYTRRDDA